MSITKATARFIYRHACALGCEALCRSGLVSLYRPAAPIVGLKVRNPPRRPVKREAERMGKADERRYKIYVDAATCNPERWTGALTDCPHCKEAVLAWTSWAA